MYIKLGCGTVDCVVSVTSGPFRLAHSTAQSTEAQTNSLYLITVIVTVTWRCIHDCMDLVWIKPEPHNKHNSAHRYSVHNFVRKLHMYNHHSSQ